MTIDDPGEFEIEEVRPSAEDALILDLDGFEGPLDVLLVLAREQKVDLAQISILQLADQYLAFVQRAREKRLDLAADYLVMAAWLAYLKSRLLLPQPAEQEEPSGEEMAAALAFQLRRLEAMREAGKRLMARPQLGRDMFARGAPETVDVVLIPVYQATLYDLLKAYAERSRRKKPTKLTIAATVDLYSVDEAIQRLRRILVGLPDWQALASFLPDNLKPGLGMRSAVASTFAASLELVRQGRVAIRQDKAFGPIYVRRRREAQ